MRRLVRSSRRSRVAIASPRVSARAPPAAGARSIDGAEFTSARGLVEGNDVRVDGAPAGTVTEPRADRPRHGAGHDRAPRRDRAAARRRERRDPPGRPDRRQLRRARSRAATTRRSTGRSRPRRTLERAAPRRPPAQLRRARADRRSKAMLVEGGVALDQRGADLNERGAGAAPRARGGRLGDWPSSARRPPTCATSSAPPSASPGEAAARDDDLGRLVRALDATLHATADRPEALDATLAGAPGQLADLARRSHPASTRGRRAGAAARRVARPLGARPGEAAAERAVPFLAAAGAGDRARSTRSSAQATDLLERADPTLDALRRALRQTLIAVGPDYERFLDALVPAAPAISEGFFVNFPDQAAEPGNQPFDPFADPRRHYWRGAAVFTCQSFGVPIEPGCLQDFLAADPRPRPRARRRRTVPQAPRRRRTADRGDDGRCRALPQARPPRRIGSRRRPACRRLGTADGHAAPGGDAAGIVRRTTEPSRDLLDYAARPMSGPSADRASRSARPSGSSGHHRRSASGSSPLLVAAIVISIAGDQRPAVQQPVRGRGRSSRRAADRAAGRRGPGRRPRVGEVREVEPSTATAGVVRMELERRRGRRRDATRDRPPARAGRRRLRRARPGRRRRGRGRAARRFPRAGPTPAIQLTDVIAAFDAEHARRAARRAPSDTAPGSPAGAPSSTPTLADLPPTLETGDAAARAR